MHDSFHHGKTKLYGINKKIKPKVKFMESIERSKAIVTS